jgi:hypothetical protein
LYQGTTSVVPQTRLFFNNNSRGEAALKPHARSLRRRLTRRNRHPPQAILIIPT